MTGIYGDCELCRKPIKNTQDVCSVISSAGQPDTHTSCEDERGRRIHSNRYVMCNEINCSRNSRCDACIDANNTTFEGYPGT